MTLPIGDLVQLGVAGMAILALVLVTMFVVRSARRENDGSLKALLAQSHKREEALAYSLEMSREDRKRLEGVIEQNTEGWRDFMKVLIRVSALVEARG